MFFIKNLIHILLNKQISKIYSKRFKNYNNTPKGVFWNNKLSQDLRLNIILDKVLVIAQGNHFSLADVGCGYGRLYKLIEERGLQNEISYHGLDINKNFINFCKEQLIIKYGTLQTKSIPSELVDFVIMSGTYNLCPTGSTKIWENYIIENLKSNWKFANKAMIFNCLISNTRHIKNNLYYSELSWVKKICEKNFGEITISKNNFLKDDITITIKKLH